MEADGARSEAWASVATLPRVLSLAEDNSLRLEPAPELQSLRTNPRHRENLVVSGELPLDGVRGDCLEISAVIEPDDAREFGLKVRCSPGGEEQTVILCAPGDKTLKVEFGRATLNQAVKYPIAYPDWAKAQQLPEEKRFTKEQVAPLELKPGEPLRLRVFLDRSVLEVFANERQCVTQRIYPTRRDSLGVALVSRGGGMKVKSLDVWDVHPVND